MNIRVSADSTCDLSAQMTEIYDIGITPLYIIMGDKTLRDGVDCTKEQIFEYVERTGSLCRTAAMSIGDYIDWFGGQLQRYDEVIHFTISAEMSASYQNACVAAAEFPEKVFVVDSRNLSNGIGHLAVDAAGLVREGKTAEQIKEILDKKKEKLNVSFVLDTLEYLHKGGRCSAVQSFGANVLNLKPCIEVRDGVMGVGRKYRGSLKKSMVDYVNERLEGQVVEDERIFICDSGVSDDIVKEVYTAIEATGKFKQIIHSLAGCTVSNHCGPNCLGILFYNK